MEESNTSVPDLKDLEVKVGRKTPEGLLKWMREDHKTISHHQTENKETEKKGLDEKIRKLKLEMAHLRAADVKILNQLIALHEGIEAVKWLLEERGALTSRCSSLTSSQYSLGEGPDTSWRGSWSSLQDPHDKLDNISIGSYLDTLADDLDEHCPSSGTDSILCGTPIGTEVSRGPGGGMSGGSGSGTRSQQVSSNATGSGTRSPQVSSNATGSGTRSPQVSSNATGSGTRSPQVSSNATGSGTRSPQVSSNATGSGTRSPQVSSNATGSGTRSPQVSSNATGSGTRSPQVSSNATGSGTRSPQVSSNAPKEDAQVWKALSETGRPHPSVKNDTNNAKANKTNGILDKAVKKIVGSDSPRACLAEKLGKNLSPKMKPYKNGKVEPETCKMNGKVQLEYDAHWRWVQSQDDVTFL